jgi:hypothetical protein
MAAWGYINWGNLLIEERSILTLKLCRRNIQPESMEGLTERSISEERSLENEDYVGIYNISGKKIMNSYRERCVLLYVIVFTYLHIYIYVYLDIYRDIDIYIYMYIYIYIYKYKCKYIYIMVAVK